MGYNLTFFYIKVQKPGLHSNRKDIESLEAYIAGTLDNKKRFAIERRLEEEVLLNEDYHYLLSIKNGIKWSALNRKLYQLKDVESEIIIEEKFETKQPFTFMQTIFAIAILGVLLTIILICRKQENQSDPFMVFSNREFHQYVLHNVERNSDFDDLRTNAYSLYSTKNFSQARPLLSALWDEQNDTLSLFYLGVTELALGNTLHGCSILHSTYLEGYPVSDLLQYCR